MPDISLGQNQHGEPVLTIKVTGGSEIFRFAWYMGHGPTDYLNDTQRVFRYLRRRWGGKAFRQHDRMITGGRVVQYGWQTDRKRE